MAKKQADAVYKIVEVVGVSDKSWEDAGRSAVETAAGSLAQHHLIVEALAVSDVERAAVLAQEHMLDVARRYSTASGSEDGRA